MDWAGLVAGVGVEAAPLPEMGFRYQILADWVAVDVAEFLDSLSFGVDVEVVVAGFPYVVFGSGAGETLLENLDGD